MADDIIVSDAHTLGGTPRFRGTRVAEGIVRENLNDGLSVEDILHSYPTLNRADVLSWLVMLIHREHEATAGRTIARP